MYGLASLNRKDAHITYLTAMAWSPTMIFMLPTEEPVQFRAAIQLEAWLDRAAKRWGFLPLIVVSALAFGIRWLRLGVANNHYYLYSPDSYFWHWLAQRVMAGEGPPPPGHPGMNPGMNYTIHSGLAYPLAYIGKAASAMFNLTPAESVALAAKLFPPILAVVTLIVIYVAISRIWGRRVALFSALASALMYLSILVTVAGYIDRDGMSALLLLTGVLIFYFLKGYRVCIGKINVGWLLTGCGVLVVEGLLYLEWGLVGAGLLVLVLLVYAVLRSARWYMAMLDSEPNAGRRILAAVRKLEWPALGFIACVNIAAAGLYHHEAAYYLKDMWGIIRASGQPVAGGTAAEVVGLTFPDIIAFQFFLIPMALGLYSAWKRKDDASILFSGWFVVFGIMSLFAWRYLLYAIPAMCIIAGLGLGYLWEWRRRGNFPLTRTLVVAVLLILILAASFRQAALLNAQAEATPDQDWQQALTYLRESTPPNAIIMSQWSPGYWILDLGQRRPFVDNGYYGIDPGRLRDVALAYLATDPSDAAQIMAKDGTDYLIFSTDDVPVAAPIMAWAGLERDNFPADSLVMQSLSGRFVSGGGLDVAYHNAEVVILELTAPQGQ
jgi:asparagine N-glycosylation enzyme membrane subunit Stt3